MIIPRIVLDVPTAVQELVDSMQNRITLEENLQTRLVTALTPGTPDTEFILIHGLGKTPRHYIYNIDSAGIVYDSRRTEWSTNSIYLKCSVANANLVITVL